MKRTKLVYHPFFTHCRSGRMFNLRPNSPGLSPIACLFVYLFVAQSVTCLATDAGLTADPGFASSIPAGSHTFMEIDREIISTVILLSSADSFKKGCFQLQVKVCA